MYLLRLILLCIWPPQAIAQLLRWVYWLQVKEYRLDRFRVFLGSKSSRKELGVLGILGKLGLIIFIYLGILPFWLYVLPLLALNFGVIGEIWRRRLRRPVFTQRAWRMLGTAVVLAGLAVLFLGANWKSLLLGELFLLTGPFLGILWTTPIVNKVRKQEIAKAKKRFAKVKPKVIGITGSYGKGTTKEFVAHLLSQKYKVAKTIGSQNTEFGIARNVDKFVKEDTDFFIAEMGAYKKGEITNLADIVTPEVGIITGIEEQHLSLFGSLDNIKKAKFELVEALPKNGVAVFNLTNKHCRELATKARKHSNNLQVLSYYFHKGKGKTVKADLVAKLVAQDVDGVTFEVQHSGDKKAVRSPLKGAHYIENLSGAILIARHFGVSWEEILKGCKITTTPKGTMQVRKYKGAVIIDDSFNNTPSGFEAALSYLSMYESREKAVVTSGIIELGRESHRVHKRLGKLMGSSIDKIILTNNDFTSSIKEGLGFSNRYKLVVEENSDRLKEIVDSLVKNDFVVLLEGRMSKLLMNNLLI